jgi:alkanesulfonate monooxygenase SsuD/methylene tetrahydromethanopterin reductase-like flavin-dependent oxidoreductase (luciferase family)
VGVHMLGYVDETTQKAADTFYPGYAKAMTDIGKERGWPPMTRASLDAQRGRSGALIVGSPEEVVDKMIRHSDVRIDHRPQFGVHGAGGTVGAL